ncbi:polysaccharide deacetylase family protein [Paenibacillus cremeus]|uniref:Polysaccharide deacetylase family protein n=1 Tax=Paenibacillus cremeus TaxID=2163881 RepID=A0A559KGW8_9BACL|nr:polysaccharide deacetylase family protein [Paenibacillus cremeus]TVY11361.1 polysaccharide deacetylase family protein [Paenibacillus cremeus]
MKKKLLVGVITFVVLTACLYANTIKSTKYENKVAVLEYHHIDPEESEFTISPERFSDQLNALKEQNFHVISMEDFVLFLRNQKPVPPKAVVITFDDGYESFYKYAYPELKKQGMSATNFLIVGSVDKTEETPPFMTWDEIMQMHEQGFSFYSHTFDSHDFREGNNGKQVSPVTNPIYLDKEGRLETENEYKQRIQTDLLHAQEVLHDRLGDPFSLLCLPHGRYTSKSIDYAKTAGIEYFITGDYGMNASGQILIDRISAGVPTLTGKQLVQKIYWENTWIGAAEDLAKNIVLKIRYTFF